MALATRISQRYQLQHTIGEGGMGIVYQAYDRLMDEYVALKLVHANPTEMMFNTTSSNAALSLAHEFRALAGLRHPNIVSVLDYGFDEARNPFYTMQLLHDAKPLTLYAGTLPQNQQIRLLIDMLQALVYLHRRGTIHRDLKPGNVLVLPDGSVKVVDFGLALHIDPSGHAGNPNDVSGTLMYMAPELLVGQRASTRSDLYAVGVILYELLTGFPPFYHYRPVDFFLNRLNDAPSLDVIPAELRDVVRQLLATKPDQRPASATEVIETLYAILGEAMPPESHEVRDSFLRASAFVGRERELSTLERAFKQMLSGHASAWLLGGESGVGKSRLLDEVRVKALCDGALVVRGQATAEGNRPYQVWRPILRRLLLEADVSDQTAAALKRIVTDIDDLRGRPSPDLPALEGRDEHQRLNLAIADVLRVQLRPVLIVLEDLQWIGESLGPIQHVLSVLDQLGKVMLIGTFRNEERPTLPDALAGATVLRLHRLDTTAMHQLAEKMLGTQANRPDLIGLLQRETEGNPFFMVEVLHALADSLGSLDDITQRNLPDRVMAGGVQALIQKRLDRLPAQHQPILKHIAVAGRDLDLRLLALMPFAHQVDDFLQHAANLNIIDITDEVWRFSHDKLRETILEQLTPTERATLNRAVAEGIEAAHGDDIFYYETLMAHWRAAEDTAKELHYLYEVAPLVMQLNAERALQVVERGLALIDNDDPRYIDLLRMAAQIHHDSGRYEAAAGFAQQALDRADRSGHHDLLFDALNVLGITYRFMGDLTAAQVAFEHALLVAERIEDTDRIATCQYRLGGLASDMGEHQTALEYLQKALNIKRQLASSRDIDAVLMTMGITLLDVGEFEQARTYIEEAQASAAAKSHQKLVAHAVYLLGHVALAGNDYLAAHANFDEAIRLARTIGNVSLEATTLNNMATTAHRLERFDEATDLLARSSVLAETLGRRPLMAANASTLAMVQLDIGTPDIADTLQSGIRLAMELGINAILIDLLSHTARLLILAENAHTAAPIVGLIENHPATTADVRSECLPSLHRDLAAALNAEALSTALADGATQDINHMAAAILSLPLPTIAQQVFGG